MPVNYVQCPQCGWTGQDADFEEGENERTCPVSQLITMCEQCGSTVDLSTTHYCATLESTRSSPTETGEVVFCSRGCVAEWR